MEIQTEIFVKPVGNIGKPFSINISGLFLLFVFLASQNSFAEKLSFKTFSLSDGLASDIISKIVPDSRGFLWFCTAEGLSRFDGYKFKNYTQNEGLPHRNVTNFLETKDGDYLVATSRGIAVFNPHGKVYRWNTLTNELEQNSAEPPLFKTYFPTNSTDKLISSAIISIAEAGDGKVYAGTNHALYRFEKINNDWQFAPVDFADWKEKRHIFNALRTDARGGLWIATNLAIYRMAKTGNIKKINESGGNSIFESRDGKVWVDSGGNDIGIRLYDFPNDAETPVLQTTYTTKDGLPVNVFSNALVQTADGRIFGSASGKFFRFLPDAKPGEIKFKIFDLPAVSVAAVYKNQSLWLALYNNGAAKTGNENFQNFDQTAGVPARISSLFGGAKGEIYAVSDNKLFRLNGERFESLTPHSLIARSWNSTFLDFQTKDSDWWIPSQNGLLHYRNIRNFGDLAKTAPSKIYTTADGLDTNEIFAAFEDLRGDIWIATVNGKNKLHRLDKKTGKIVVYTAADGLPAETIPLIKSFGEDAAGNIWISWFGGELARYKDGKFRVFTEEKLLPPGTMANMFSDSKGRFWLASVNRGLFRVDNPNDETPIFTSFSTADGLPSNQTFWLLEDNFGRIYVGTGRGIVRLEPETAKIKVYTTGDGLPSNIFNNAEKDKNGNLWFASSDSITKFVPQADVPPTSPPIFIEGITANGVPESLSELGETAVKNLEFAPEERQIQINFFGISLESGEALRYQYKSGGQDWSAPSEQRSVAFDLAAGNYDFAVRAVNSAGLVSETPATVSFTVLSPIYLRGWFLTLAIAGGCFILWAIYQYRTKNLRNINAALAEAKTAEEKLRKSREERLAELQRVRTRIATDLHDDIGSSLTQISVFSELARRRERENGAAGEHLDMISGVADELVDTMSDIVWAINPKKDHLQDLTQRMRRFAANVLTAKDIDLEFLAPASDTEIPLGANIRREVFLIFKETVNNIVKHSDATEAEIVFRSENGYLNIVFKDNGKGFEQNAGEGENGDQDWKRLRGSNGLLNMKKRAAELSGSYEVKSAIGKGTSVVLKVPLEI